MSQIEDRLAGLTLEQKRALAARLLREKARGKRSQAEFAHRLFESQAARNPVAPALSGAGGSMTYGELNASADRLAKRLRSLGVGPEVLVGLCLSRSPRLVVALLAVLKAGGAYLPLDPNLPGPRLAYMLEDANVPLLITELDLVESIPSGDARVLCVDSDWEEESAEGEPAPAQVTIEPENLAYVIYTSGSTGRPKGVQIPHAALANFLGSMKKLTSIGAEDALLAVTTLSFDIAALEIFLPLSVGARVELVERDVAADGARLAERLSDPGITFLQATPATWRLLLEAGWQGHPGLSMLCGGEALNRSLANRLVDKGKVLWNVYGPTETTIWSSIERVEAGEGPVPIGRPIANTQLYVLDKGSRPTPVGVTGELFIGGQGLARGYLNRPGLTAEKFVPDPFGPEPGGRLYRTGDLARWRLDGSLECLGRVDHQVKVRGFRVELGEIEAALSAHPEVREAAVAARADSTGETSLAAYVVPRGEPAGPSAAELRRWLLTSLPDYMIPSAFVTLDALPLTPNGKIDRNALPEPNRIGGRSSSPYIPPRGPIEEAIAGVWTEVLGVDRVGSLDNFFELGGHSLMAIQLVARMKHTFGVELPLKDFVDEPTVGRLARLVEEALADGSGVQAPPIVRIDRNGPVPASFAQQRLWFLDQLEPGLATYNIPTAVHLTGDLDVNVLESAMGEIIRRHEVLRTTFDSVGGVPRQVIADPTPLSMAVEDLRGIDEGLRAAEVARLVAEEAARPFDLARGPLIRARLLRSGDREHVLLVNMHHIISDGWSIGVLVREASALYESYREAQPSPLPEPTIQYADYAVWQREWLQGDILQVQLDYWSNQLRDLPSLELPTDRPGSASSLQRGAERVVVLPRSLLDSVRDVGRREGATLFMTLLSAFEILIQRYSSQELFAIGSPIAGRNRAEVEGLIGFFVNTMVLRADLTGDPNFVELLGRTRKTAIDAYVHQDLPFEQLVGVLRPDRNAAGSPLFRVMFVLQNAPLPALESPGLRLELLDSPSGTAKFDLTLFAIEEPEGLRLKIEYSTDLFEATTVDRMLNHYRTLLESAVAEPDRPIGSLNMLTEEERRQVLTGWNEADDDLDGLGDDELDSLLDDLSSAEISKDE